MVKKQKRNKKFWSGAFMTFIGTITLGVSYLGNTFFQVDGWFWNMNQEVGGIGITILIVGLALMIFNKDVSDVVA